MTDEDIRIAAAQKLADERRALPDNPETTPSKITAAIRTFCETLSDTPLIDVPVIDDPHGRFGWCSDGVRLKVAADGGVPVYGWTIWEWPPGLVTAEFHCVWRSPAGELMDITPKPHRETRIIFVEDKTYQSDFNFDLRPRNRRVRSYEPIARDATVQALLVSLTGSKRAYEEGRAARAGLSLEAWLDRKVPQDPLPATIDAFITLCSEFEEHFDTLGNSGLVRPDAKFIDLAKRRHSSQQFLRKLMEQAARAQRISH